MKKDKLTIFLTNLNLNIHNLHHYLTFNHDGKKFQTELIAIFKTVCETLMRKRNYNNYKNRMLAQLFFENLTKGLCF